MDTDGGWTIEMTLLIKLAGLVQRPSGGLTKSEQAALAIELGVLAREFGVSEDLLLRYIRAKSTYDTVIFDKLWAQARMDAIDRINELGKDPLVGPEYSEELRNAFRRLRDALPENEITREFNEAQAAIRAALKASTPEEK